MASVAADVNAAAVAALEQAKKECGAEVRDTWLWVDSSKPGSDATHGLGSNAGNYTQSHQQYLEGLGVTGPFFHDLPDTAPSYNREQGADAIADISKFFDWTPGSCRSIFYVSDTALEGVSSTLASNDLAKDQAIGVANANNVTVFAHKVGNSTGGTTGMTITDIFDDYDELCSATGGSAETGGAASASLYEDLISKAICNCGGGCVAIETPKIIPCISVSWGDSDCDSFETDDFEILCITVCNCYSNITFENFSIGMLEITNSDGRPAPTLPDGTPSVQVVPVGPICFGDIAPCNDGKASCVSREFVINTRGAKEGEYRINLHAVCYDVTFAYHGDSCFIFKLCKS